MRCSMSEIKTNFEFPRGEDNKKFLQRLVQDLSKNFKYISDKTGISSMSNGQSSNFIDINVTWTGTASKTLTHGLGKTPSGWSVIDIYANGSSITFVWPTRTSWDTTNITLYMNTGSTVSLKIRVFV